MRTEPIRIPRRAALLAIPSLAAAAARLGAAGPDRAVPLTREGFTAGIEGPACDRDGAIYCVSYLAPENIARVTPDGRAEVFVTLPRGSTGNGIRIGADGVLLVADYTAHNVLRVEPATRRVSVLVHEPRMNQPNDLALARDGTLYASDPDWKRGTGQLWRIPPGGGAILEAQGLGTTNGLDLSPDGRTLYVNESVQRGLWAWPVRPDGSLGERRLVRQFDDHGFDGMRCDIDGRLFVTRHGKGTVAVLSPEGRTLREVDVLGPNPTNLCFGGPDGCTVYVTEAGARRLVSFRTDRPGLEWVRQQPGRQPE